MRLFQFGIIFVQLFLLTSAAVIPLSRSTCTPSFSGLVQSIRHSSQRNLGWQAVLGKSGKREGSLIGVKAGEFTKKAYDGLALEWVIDRTSSSESDSTFTITSVASMMACLGADDSLKLQSPLKNPKRSCAKSASYEFEVVCTNCDRFDDRATGCQIRSSSNKLCAQADKTTGKLSWDKCAASTIERYNRQLFDIGAFTD